MISKKKIRLIRSLRFAKFRNQNRKFIAEGPKVVDELLGSTFSIDQIYATGEWLRMHNNPRLKPFLTEITENELKAISNLTMPNQVLAVVELPQKPLQIPVVSGFVLMLDGISDPGNMGTIIRTADWFGIQFIICSEYCVDLYNPKVIQATAGSVFRIQVFYMPLEEYLANTSADQNIFGAMLEGENIYTIETGQQGIILIGNESHGISSKLLPFIKKKIRIPGYSKDRSFAAESLNASIATAVICAEFMRRKE
jgi:TrmH family RNA methyltransferase